MFTHDLTGISVSFVKKKAIENESSKEAESKWIPCKIKIVQIKRWYYLSNKFQAQHVNDNLFSKLVYSFGSISSCNLIRIAILVSKNVAFFCVWQHINIMAMQCILMCSINRETQNQELLHMLVWFANIGYLVAKSKGDFRAVAAGCNGEEETKLWWAKMTDSSGHNSFQMIGFSYVRVYFQDGYWVRDRTKFPPLPVTKVHMLKRAVWAIHVHSNRKTKRRLS